MATKKKPAAKKAKPKSNLGYADPKRSKKAEVKKPKKSARPQRLPGMEDAAIDELENIARDIKDCDTEITEIRKQRKDHVDSLITAMKRMGRVSYNHEGIIINLADETKAKVKVKPPKEELTNDSPEVDLADAVPA